MNKYMFLDEAYLTFLLLDWNSLVMLVTDTEIRQHLYYFNCIVLLLEKWFPFVRE